MFICKIQIFKIATIFHITNKEKQEVKSTRQTITTTPKNHPQMITHHPGRLN